MLTDYVNMEQMKNAYEDLRSSNSNDIFYCHDSSLVAADLHF